MEPVAGAPERYRFTDDDAAREWLLANGEDEAAKSISRDRDERGPGRPEIGPADDPPPEDMIEQLDKGAAAKVSRAEDRAPDADGGAGREIPAPKYRRRLAMPRPGSLQLRRKGLQPGM